MAKQEMKTPYAMLIAKKDDPSKIYYMIAELIDNSISSWEERDISKKDDELSIIINIDNVKREIKTVDNAEGMNKQKLENAIRLHEISEKKNGLNMFGVGLKNSAFWFAEDLIITSKTSKDDANKTSIITSKIKDKSKTVKWEAVPCKTKRKGTTIEFKNVYKDKLPSPKDIKELTEILSFKYNKYIQDGIKILIKYRHKETSEIKKYHLKDLKIQSEIIPVKQAEDFIKHLDEALKGKQIKYLKTMREQVVNLVKNEKPLDLKFNIKYKYEDKEEILEFHFGILAKEYKSDFSKYSGLTTYQHRRAINLPPKNTLSLGEKIRTNIKRVYASVELGELFKPDNNKTEFAFGIHKEHFLEMVKDGMGKEILILADVVFDVISGKERIKAGISKNSQPKLQRTLNNKMNCDWVIKQNNSKLEITLKDQTKINVKITEVEVSDKNKNNYFINARAKKGDLRECIIEYNVGHPVWKPLSNADTINSIDSKTVIYPIVAIVGLTSILGKEKEVNKMLNVEGDIDVLSIINGITNVLTK